MARACEDGRRLHAQPDVNDGLVNLSQVKHTLEPLVERDGIGVSDHGVLTIAPSTEAECAHVLQTAFAHRWTVRLCGLGGWCDDDRPTDLVLNTRRLNRICEVKPEDLFATVEAGVTMDAIRETLGASNRWLPIDEPGANRTIGSVASTATAGPLQTGYGPVRDHILGMTVLTPMGNTIVAGGKVVKNVAGFDLPKLVIGGFGAFGLITKLHLRVRVAPESDVTMIATGDRGKLLDGLRRLVADAVPIAAQEIRSPVQGATEAWSLAVRVTGTQDSVKRRQESVRQAAGSDWQILDAAAARDWSRTGRLAAMSSPVTMKMAPQPSAIDETLSAVDEILDAGYVSFGVGRPQLRWSGNANAAALSALRGRLAEALVPLTIERAPWQTLSSAGHFGSLRSGVASLVASLRSNFDPGATLTVPIVGV